MNDLERMYAFERRLLERLSTRIEPFAFGEAFFDEDYRERYDSNFLMVHWHEDVTAQMLAGEADRVLGGSGYRHREVVVHDDEHGGRLSPGFIELGYKAERFVTMVHRREPHRRPALETVESTFAELRPMIREGYDRDDEIVDSVDILTDQHGKLERVIGARFFAVRIDGVPAGSCELYVDGDDAQVENVATLEEFRGRGVASAVVLRAVDEARAAGARHTFIQADEDDWPKDLYERLGFDRLGVDWGFIRWPEGAAPPPN